MANNHKILFLTLVIAAYSYKVLCQPSDTTLSQSTTGVKLIEATNSISFLAGFSYDAASTNEMYARITPTAANSNYRFTEQQESGNLPTSTAYPVGSINGTVNVGLTGAANYTIPIDIPPGRNGMKPNLSLVYNSQGGDGLLGLGWALSGLSSITRVPTNLYHETYIDVVDFDSNDKFALDGQRLISTGGDQYRTEIYSFSKITMFGSATNPSYFKVETKEGLELYYGNTTDSKFEVKNSSNVYAWYLNQVQDKNGNFYTITYSENNSTGEIYRESINYSGYGSTTGDYTIEFGYTPRSNSVQSWVNGYPLTISQLLNLITIKYLGATVGKFQINYSNSKLREIIKFGKNNSRLNSNLVNWGTADSLLLESNRTAISTLQGRYQGDFNGDGKTDLVIIKSSSGTCSLYQADQTGTLVFKLNYSIPTDYLISPVYPGDYNGDGLTDLLGFRLILGAWVPSFLISNGSSFTRIDHPPLGGPSALYYQPGDYNGNGKADLMIQATTGSFNCLIYEFTFPAGGGVSSNQIGYNNIVWGDKGYTLIKEVPFDMNGDGKTELMTLSSTGCKFYGLQDGSTIINEICSLGYPTINNVNLFGDFNGDGLTDLFSFDLNNLWKINFSKANGFDEHITTAFNNFNPYTTNNNFYSWDINGDGKCDIVVVGRGTNVGNPVKIYVGYSNGQDFSLVSYTPTANIEISPDIVQYDYNHFGDYNGDGVIDLYYDKGSFAKFLNIFRGRSQYFVSEFRNGFGYWTHLNYAPLTSSAVYGKGFPTVTYPIINLQTPLYVASSVLQDNPDFSHSTTSYYYIGAHYHLLGKGFLGFESVYSTNSSLNTSIQNQFEYNATYFNISPKVSYTYSVLSDTAFGELISKTEYTNNVIAYGSKRIFPYVDYSIETNYLSGVVINKDLTYDSNGNITTYREDYDDGSYYITSNSNFSSAGTWLPAKPQTVTISKKHYQDSQTYSLTTSYTYYSTTGLINTKSDGLLTTTFGYDGYGNLTSESISDGTTSRLNHYEYDNKNMFPWKSYNPLNHITEITFDYVTGNVLTEKSPNNVVTNFIYDDFGNLKASSIPVLGKYQTITYGWTTGTRPLGAVFSKQTWTDYSPSLTEYYDAFGKVLKTVTTGFDGNPVSKNNVYNNKGQISEVSLPYKASDTPLKTVYYYDRYGHKIKEESDAGVVSTTFSGKSIQISGSSGQTSAKTLDSQGNIVQASDNAGTITYSYKSVGKPSTISTNGSSWTMQYDNYGRQTSLADPNAGTISYRYNKFNELTSQTDARGKIDSMTFDVLGRVLTEVRDEGNKAYTYDSVGRLGLLSNVVYPGGVETYNYDNYERLKRKIVRIDGTDFSTSYGYDTCSRIQTITYPSNFSIKNTYVNGYITEVRRGDNNSLIWQGSTVNSFGQFTQFTLGNSLTTTKSYDCLGSLKNITTGTIQNLMYSFDEGTGNLLSCKDNNRSLMDIFTYDNINRLTGVSGPSSLAMTYASSGNILSKTSVGDYSYGGSKPHAVTSVTNPNGLISTTAQRVTYTSFSKADSIIQANLIYTVAYGSNDQRTMTKSFDNGTLQKTVYYVDGYEKEVTPGNHIRQIHYIGGGDGIAAIFVRNDGADTMYYVHPDYLGSFNVVTNSNGSVKCTYSFDAWGRRRNPADWSYNSIPTSFLFTRGYTGHEMLDQFYLINMNGRIYDPLLARFVSPDDFVQSPDFTQNFNRYSYCLNNPLIYSDPSGEIIFTILSAIFCPALLPIAIGTDIGWISGGIRGANTPGMTFLDGAWRGGITGAVGGALSMVGGGTFVANVAWGMGGGAITGGLDAALWGNDIGKGMLNGAAIGGAFAAVQSGYQIVHNGLEYGYWNTDIIAFDKMVEGANYTLNGTTMVNQTRAQGALNFWQDRFGGPALTYSEEHMGWAANGTPFHDYQSPSAALNGKISIPSEKFILGSDVVKRSIAHETGHYYFNIPWSNKPGGSVNGKNFINLDLSKYGGDGIFGYGNAIRNAGLYHINFDVIAHAADTKYGAQAWRDYNFFKWLFLIPRRF